MCDLTGKIAGILMLTLVAKYAVRKLKLKRLNRMLGSIHKLTGLLFMMTGTIHAVFSIPLFETCGPLMIISGIISLAIFTIISFSGSCIGKKKQAITWHRWGSIIALISIVLHSFR